MNKLICLGILMVTFATNTYSQREMPKNYPGFFGGVEWNSISGLVGIDYERSFYHNEKFGIGIKALHIFRYNVSNLEILGSSNEGTTALTALMCSGYLFTSSKKDNSGFFLYSAVGPGFQNRNYSGDEQTKVFMAFEAGLGWQFFISDDVVIKWSNSILFAPNGGITISKISLGF